jgi:hypothetical protein
MLSWFAIFNNTTGELGTIASDDTAAFPTDAELTAKGCAKKTVNGPLLATEQWNTATRLKEARPADPNETLRQTLIAKNVSVTPFTVLEKDQAMQLLLKAVKF